jgi:hypothetical protein
MYGLARLGALTRRFTQLVAARADPERFNNQASRVVRANEMQCLVCAGRHRMALHDPSRYLPLMQCHSPLGSKTAEHMPRLCSMTTHNLHQQ